MRTFVSFLIACALFLLPVEANAQPTFVRFTGGQATNSTLTISIEVDAGSDQVLVFAVAYKSNSVLTETSIDFNTSEAFNLVNRNADQGNAQVTMWVLPAPTQTTANAVLVMPGTVRMVGYVALFNGVDGTDPFTANTSEAQGTDNAPTVNISSASDETCVDMMVMVSADPNTATPDHTVMVNLIELGGGTDTRGASQRVVGTGTRTMGWATTDSDDWNVVAACLQEPVAAPTGVPGVLGGNVGNIGPIGG